MTIKHTNQNISAEPTYIITGITSNPNGILTITKADLYNEQTTTEEIDLSKHKLQLKKLNAETDLTLLASCLTDQDTQELTDLNTRFSSEYNITFESVDEVDEYRKSKIFLTQHSQSNTEEGIYREHIWVEDAQNQRFEVIGSTKAVLEDYIQKSNTSGYVKNDGTISSLATVAESGDYTDLINKPDLRNIGTFAELQTLINNATTGSVIVLDRDYVNSGSENPILISKSLTIEGGHHIIDSHHQNGIFHVSGNNNISLNISNLVFLRGEKNSIGAKGAAIECDENSIITLNIYNCVFSNNIAYFGGAIYYTGASAVIEDCIFYKNHAENAGALYVNSSTKVNNCKFFDNTAYSNYDDIQGTSNKNYTNTRDLVPMVLTFDDNTTQTIYVFNTNSGGN